jgi:hypothetical protein
VDQDHYAASGTPPSARPGERWLAGAFDQLAVDGRRYGAHEGDQVRALTNSQRRCAASTFAIPAPRLSADTERPMTVPT